MVVANATAAFEYGSEVQGRGYMTLVDSLVGGTMWLMSFAALMLGILNIYLVREMPIFHNAFGRFWTSRTVGEVGSNLVHVFYSARQPKGMPPQLGIIAFTIGYFFACEACVMHQLVSFNRMLAVCSPVNYRSVFTKRVTKMLIAFCWTEIFVIIAQYYVFPCNIIGYSPTFYEYVFVKCSPTVDQEYSIVGTIVNRVCFGVCLLTMVTDLITLSRIIHIRMTNKFFSKQIGFRRDVRFFGQTSVQNITMVICLSFIVIVNNSKENGLAFDILAFDTLILTHLNNALALILFNPEVRKFLGIRCSLKSAIMAHTAQTTA